MKKFIYLISGIALLMNGCDTDDDGFYNRVYLTAEAPVAGIVEENIYMVGDPLQIWANIPAVLNVEGQEEDVDIRRTSQANVFDFSFVLERQVGSNWEIVDVSSAVHAVDGAAIGGYFVEAKAVYNGGIDAYVFNGGINILQSGNYRLSFTYNSELTDVIELFSASPANNIRINIKSPTTQLDSDGYFYFEAVP